MPWPAEMEVIDQLLGGDLPLPVICGLFTDDRHARRVLAKYLSKGVIVFVDQEAALPDWKWQEMFRRSEALDQYIHVRVSLSDKGAKAFEEGKWDTL